MRFLALRIAALAVCSLALGCIAANGGSGSDTGGNSGNSDGGGSTCSPACGSGTTCQGGQCVSADGGGGSKDGGGQQGTDAGGEVDLTDGGACKAESYNGQKQPLDMYIMLDRSRSMEDPVTGGTRRQVVTAALKTYLDQPGQDGVSVGLQYFPLGAGTAVSCDSADYAQVAIEIGPIAETKTSISSSLDSVTTKTGTPTSAALAGAIAHAGDWAKSHTQDVVIVVFATDGEPNGCVEDINQIQQIAAGGVNATPRILTFVIGVGMSSKGIAVLNAIASSGGTGAPFLVSDADVTTQFKDALDKIRGDAVACNYLIPTPPAGQTPDYNKVNVIYTPTGGSAVKVFKVSDASACSASQDAWYYDNPSSPTHITLCPATCDKAEGDATAKVEILLGCATEGPK
jgi:hypothetical protein